MLQANFLTKEMNTASELSDDDSMISRGESHSVVSNRGVKRTPLSMNTLNMNTCSSIESISLTSITPSLTIMLSYMPHDNPEKIQPNRILKPPSTYFKTNGSSRSTSPKVNYVHLEIISGKSRQQ
jgi:hypothetical protein